VLSLALDSVMEDDTLTDERIYNAFEQMETLPLLESFLNLFEDTDDDS
jgi:hypothetical protein